MHHRVVMGREAGSRRQSESGRRATQENKMGRRQREQGKRIQEPEDSSQCDRIQT